MTDRATPNLPARDFGETAAFWARLGFRTSYRDDHWMILARGDMQVEFFPHPGVDKWSSWFSACLRVDDLDALHAEWAALDLPRDNTAIPRLTAITDRPPVPRMFAMVDADGSLIRVLENGR
ncbi:MAG: bleomycin resistance protein [Paracoccaceae bacterium]|nr:MAG: bleomycin resistance protein [Paracoccaceae bacterium]